MDAFARTLTVPWQRLMVLSEGETFERFPFCTSIPVINVSTYLYLWGLAQGRYGCDCQAWAAAGETGWVG